VMVYDFISYQKGVVYLAYSSFSRVEKRERERERFFFFFFSLSLFSMREEDKGCVYIYICRYQFRSHWCVMHACVVYIVCMFYFNSSGRIHMCVCVIFDDCSQVLMLCYLHFINTRVLFFS